MSMRTNTLVTYLQPEEAYALIDFLDQVRAMLMQTYGAEIRTMLREATLCNPGGDCDDDLTF